MQCAAWRARARALLCRHWTHASHQLNRHDSRLVPRCDPPSFFNGIHPENLFFQGVACQLIKVEMGKAGLDTEFALCEIDCSDAKQWEGTLRSEE